MVSDREPPWGRMTSTGISTCRCRRCTRATGKNLIRRYHVGSTLVAHCNRLEVGNLRFTNVGGLGPGLVSGIG
jgi:hypothetical protein